MKSHRRTVDRQVRRKRRIKIERREKASKKTIKDYVRWGNNDKVCRAIGETHLQLREVGQLIFHSAVARTPVTASNGLSSTMSRTETWLILVCALYIHVRIYIARCK